MLAFLRDVSKRILNYVTNKLSFVYVNYLYPSEAILQRIYMDNMAVIAHEITTILSSKV